MLNGTGSTGPFSPCYTRAVLPGHTRSPEQQQFILWEPCCATTSQTYILTNGSVYVRDCVPTWAKNGNLVPLPTHWLPPVWHINSISQPLFFSNHVLIVQRMYRLRVRTKRHPALNVCKLGSTCGGKVYGADRYGGALFRSFVPFTYASNIRIPLEGSNYLEMYVTVQRSTNNFIFLKIKLSRKEIVKQFTQFHRAYFPPCKQT